VISYLIIKLGHKTLIKGVSGDLDFSFSGALVQTKLASAYSGALFALAGATVII
jgi:hypothetical protein